MKEIKMIDVNLQLFAGDEDFDYDETIDSDDLNIDDETDANDDDNSDDDSADLDNDDSADADAANNADNETKTQKESNQTDKVTKALIEQKRLNKQLKEKLDLIEQQNKAEDQKSKKKALVDKYLEKGYDDEDAEAEATKQLETESLRNTVKKLAFITENDDILSKYPDAKKNVEKLIRLKDATGWSVEKICSVEFEVKESAFDSKVKNDQAERLKQKKRLSTPAGGQTTMQGFKLDPEDEKAYQFYSKKNPGVGRKEYASKIGFNDSQKIPHDKWD